MHPRCRAVALASVLSIGATAINPIRATSPVAGQNAAIRASSSSVLGRRPPLVLYRPIRGSSGPCRGHCASSEDDGMAAYELRSSALLFQIRRAIGEPKDKDQALRQCDPCPGLMSDFRDDVDAGRRLARTKFEADRQGRDRAVLSRQTEPEPRLAATGNARPADRMERVLGSPTFS